MTNIRVELVAAFTAGGSGGNPAGVVLDAETLTDKQKLAIAREIGYSETAFVSSDIHADFNVSFFTVTEEVDFCGHATLATFSLMYQKGILSPGTYNQQTRAGLLSVCIRPDGHISMEQSLPEWYGVYPCSDIAGLLGIPASVLESTQMPVCALSTGLPDLIVAVPEGHLDCLTPDHEAITEFCRENELVGIHAFELCGEDELHTASCRNFAPLLGIEEESATGSASGVLACYLNRYLNGATHFLFEQGRAMNCRSEISAEVEPDGIGIKKVIVGGSARQFGVRELNI